MISVVNRDEHQGAAPPMHTPDAHTAFVVSFLPLLYTHDLSRTEESIYMLIIRILRITRHVRKFYSKYAVNIQTAVNLYI